MKGYLTVFLALTLSVMTGFILLLAGMAVKNAGKVRLECAVDTGMNAVLAEFHTELFERYGLLYVDASYLEKVPAISNVEGRLKYYVDANTTQLPEQRNAPWGSPAVEQVRILSFETAAADQGASMRSQAVCYAEDLELCGDERDAFGQMEEIRALEAEDPMGEWMSVMATLAGMELPCIQNEKGEWEEVPLSNPADWVFGLVGSSILYLTRVDGAYLNPARVSLQEYISHRGMENSTAGGRVYREEKELFLSYLFDRMGYFENGRDGSLLGCQLEYLAYGGDSDLENMEAVAKTLLKWRFADNASRARADGDLRSQAAAAAQEFLVVALKAEFSEPVVESILYACAFLESIADVESILAGGSVPLRKSGHTMSVSHVLNGNLYRGGDGGGWSYRQYLAAMVLLAGEEELNLRAMDIMEMDLRYQDGNRNFAMDWCLERLEARVTARSGRDRYEIWRKYGYY